MARDPLALALPLDTVVELPEMAFVDDSRALQLTWRAYLRGQAHVHLFDRPESFRAALEREPELAARLRAVVIDHRFSNSREDGLSLAAHLRTRAPQLWLVLSSSGVFTSKELSLFDVSIDKSPVPFSQLISGPSARKSHCAWRAPQDSP